jgi:hypothetical protein
MSTICNRTQPPSVRRLPYHCANVKLKPHHMGVATDTTDLSTTSQHIKMLSTNLLVTKYGKLAGDTTGLPEICPTHEHPIIMQQISNKAV